MNIIDAIEEAQVMDQREDNEVDTDAWIESLEDAMLVTTFVCLLAGSAAMLVVGVGSLWLIRKILLALPDEKQNKILL